MNLVIFLDSAPLSLIVQPKFTPEVREITQWLSACIASGHRVIAPAIIYYELRRELLRANRASSLDLLEAFISASPNRYEPLSDVALRLAAELWARSRREGKPTADSKNIDVDVILAAQALSFNGNERDIVVATTNSKHLSRFVDAKTWNEIN